MLDQRNEDAGMETHLAYVCLFLVLKKAARPAATQRHYWTRMQNYLEQEALSFQSGKTPSLQARG